MDIPSFDRLYIGGELAAPDGDARIEISPHTEEVIASVPDGTPADIDRAVAARRAFADGAWGTAPPGDGLELVRRVGAAYQKRVPEFAELVTAENGCPVSISQL